jgi:hypothetical protein
MPLKKKDGGRSEVDTRRMARVQEHACSANRPATAELLTGTASRTPMYFGALVSGLRLYYT